MKLNKMLSVIGIALFGAVSVSAGVALANRNAEPVKADDEKTWIATFALDLTGFSTWEGSTFEDIQVHCWSESIGDRWDYLHPTGVDYLYAATLPYTSSESIAGFEFGFNEVNGGAKSWKVSNWNTIAYSSEDHEMLTILDTNDVTWDGDTFNSGSPVTSDISYTELYEEGGRPAAAVHEFSEDPANNRYTANFEVASGELYYTSIFFANTYDNTRAILNDAAEDLSFGTDGGSFGFKSAGSYQIAINNIFADNGIATISELLSPGYYLVGSFNEWDTTTFKDAIPLSQSGDDVASESVYLEDDTELKCVYTDGNGGLTWYNQDPDENITLIEGSYDDYPVYLSDPNKNIHIENAGNYQFNIGVSHGKDKALYSVDALDYDPSAPVEYDLYVGETKYTLEKQESGEYKATVNLVAGSTLSYTRKGVAVDSIAKASSNNNLTADKKVIVSGESKDVYVDIVAKTIWAAGLPILSNGFHLYKNTTIFPLTYDEYADEYFSDYVTCEADDELRFIHVQDNVAPIIFGNVEIAGGEQSSYFAYNETKGCIVCKEENQIVLYLKLGTPNYVWLANPTESMKNAVGFATAFDTALAAICKDSGTDVEALVTAWGAQKVEFFKLSIESQSILREATKETTGELGLFIAKYELIASRYSTQLGEADPEFNFLNKAISPAAAFPIDYGTNSFNSSALITMIILTSLIAVTTISLAVVLKVNKRD